MILSDVEGWETNSVSLIINILDSKIVCSRISGGIKTMSLVNPKEFLQYNELFHCMYDIICNKQSVNKTSQCFSKETHGPHSLPEQQ